MKKILCVGEALIDMICTDRGKSLSEGQNFLKKPGGAPLNVAAAIAALGGKAELAAKVGNDPFGKFLVNVMREFNVSTRWVCQDHDYFTTLAFVSLMENGERDFYFNRGADGQLNSQEVNAIDLDEFSIVHFGSATAFLPGPLQAAYRELLKKCSGKEIFVSFDPNYRHLLFQSDPQPFIDQSWKFIHSCHFLKLSGDEAMLITGQPTVNESAASLLQRTKCVFAITLGKQGALLGMNGSTIPVPTIDINPIDTTGAGDAFVGALLYQLHSFSLPGIMQLTTDKWQELIFNANKAGARACEYMGGMEALKHLRRIN